MHDLVLDFNQKNWKDLTQLYTCLWIIERLLIVSYYDFCRKWDLMSTDVSDLNVWEF